MAARGVSGGAGGTPADLRVGDDGLLRRRASTAQARLLRCPRPVQGLLLIAITPLSPTAAASRAEPGPPTDVPQSPVRESEAAMARHFLLNTGAKMPSVGLGTRQADPAVVRDAVYAAVKAGYRHIDCAREYGNEKEIGLVMKKLFEEGIVKHEDLFITSKLWNDRHAPEDVPEALNGSLSDLQLDYLDLYLAYSPLGSPGTLWMNGNVLKEPIIISIAETLGKTPGQVALLWNIQVDHSVLPKSTNQERINQNLDVYDWTIQDDLLAKIQEINQPRLLRGDFMINPQSVYKTLWDGEI